MHLFLSLLPLSFLILDVSAQCSAITDPRSCLAAVGCVYLSWTTPPRCGDEGVCADNCGACDSTECVVTGAGGNGACFIAGAGPNAGTCVGLLCANNCENCSLIGTECQDSFAPPFGCEVPGSVDAEQCVPASTNEPTTEPTTDAPTREPTFSQEPSNVPSQSPSISPTTAVVIDEVGCGIDHCNRYFDGCNECFCKGSTPFCTKRACHPLMMMMQKPYCMGCERGYILNQATNKCEVKYSCGGFDNCVAYNDGCNDMRCGPNGFDGRGFPVTNLQCFARGTPKCNLCAEGYILKGGVCVSA